MTTLAGILLALLAIGFVRAYIAGGWPAATHFVRLKVIGQ